MTADRPVAFYCVCDERYFLGAVGMINSLRLQGHDAPVFLLDCGLTAAQREVLAPHVTIVPAPDYAPPWLMKTIIPLAHPARVMVLVDTDMVVTRPLTTLIDQAYRGRVVVFEDRQDRFFAEWGELLELGTARRRPYVSSGLTLLGGSIGTEVLRLMDERQARVDFDLTFWRANVREYPFLYADQDVLNAILCTRADGEHVIALDQRLAATPPYRGLRVVDEAGLRCAYEDGTEPYVVHQYVRKPWLERTYHGVYSRLLARLLLGTDVAVRVPQSEVPLRMRDGFLARAERARVNAKDFLRWHLGDLLPRPIGARVEAFRRRRAAGGA
jgi:hypothetical protein